MKRLLLLVPFVLSTTYLVHAQTSNPLIEETKENYSRLSANLEKAAEAMPEADYSFKPTPEIRSFGELVAHIADAQARLCSAASGQPKAVNAQAKTSKADLVNAIKESSSICTSALDSVTDANANQMISMGPRKLSKLGVLVYNMNHSSEEYGYLAVYLRLKGVVPPSTAGRKK